MATRIADDFEFIRKRLQELNLDKDGLEIPKPKSPFDKPQSVPSAAPAAGSWGTKQAPTKGSPTHGPSCSCAQCDGF